MTHAAQLVLGAAAPPAGSSAALQKWIYQKNKYINKVKRNMLKVNWEHESLQKVCRKSAVMVSL